MSVYIINLLNKFDNRTGLLRSSTLGKNKSYKKKSLSEEYVSTSDLQPSRETYLLQVTSDLLAVKTPDWGRTEPGSVAEEKEGLYPKVLMMMWCIACKSPCLPIYLSAKNLKSSERN